MPRLRCLLLISLGSVFISNHLYAQAVSFRYFLTEQEWQTGAQVDSLKTGVPGLKVYYNEENLPVSVQYLNREHEVWQERINRYDAKSVLTSVTYFDQGRKATRKIIYEPDEAWSKSFRNYLFQEAVNISFDGAQTEFYFQDEGTLEKIVFYAVNGDSYGLIRFHYDYLGNIREEVWYKNPGHIPVRRFVYDFDINTGTRKLWEYDGEGEEVSYVELEMAPADALYAYPQPRTGNILDEVDLIIRDIRKTGISPAIPTRIPSTVWDRLQYKTGETVDIELVAIENGYITFSFPGEQEELHLPLSRVRQVRTRWGESVYP